MPGMLNGANFKGYWSALKDLLGSYISEDMCEEH